MSTRNLGPLVVPVELAELLEEELEHAKKETLTSRVGLVRALMSEALRVRRETRRVLAEADRAF